MENTKQIYTDFIITSRGGKSIKRYFESLKRHMPKPWSVEKTEYEDVHTFRILNDVMCIKSFAFQDKLFNKKLNSKLFLGLTETDIRLLKFESGVEISDKEHELEIIGYVIDAFHTTVLKTNKHYKDFNHNFQFGGPTDENWMSNDIRDSRTIKLYSEKEKVTYFLSPNEKVNIPSGEINYIAPNSIAVSLSLMKKSIKKAKALYSTIIIRSQKDKTKFNIRNKKDLYDYFEEVQTCIIFSYIAIEAFANAAIPNDFVHERFNEKGVKEVWNKTSIERWMNTSEKVGTILPKVLNSSDIKAESFWHNFKILEKLRNELVHQRTIEKDTALDTTIYSEMLKPNIFSIIQSSTNVIDFYYKLNNAHPYFPLGLGIAKFQIAKIESMEKHFEKLDED